MRPRQLLPVIDHSAETATAASTRAAGLDLTESDVPTASAPSVPVFVDATGRRARWLRLLGVVLCLVVALYLGTLASGVFGSSVDLSTATPQVIAPTSGR